MQSSCNIHFPWEQVKQNVIQDTVYCLSERISEVPSSASIVCFTPVNSTEWHCLPPTPTSPSSQESLIRNRILAQPDRTHPQTLQLPKFSSNPSPKSTISKKPLHPATSREESPKKPRNPPYSPTTHYPIAEQTPLTAAELPRISVRESVLPSA